MRTSSTIRALIRHCLKVTLDHLQLRALYEFFLYFGPDVSKDPSEMTSDTCSDIVSDDDLISDWIQEAARGCHGQVQSSPIDEERKVNDFDLFDYEFVDEQQLMTNELHPYSNDDLESFLL